MTTTRTTRRLAAALTMLVTSPTWSIAADITPTPMQRRAAKPEWIPAPEPVPPIRNLVSNREPYMPNLTRWRWSPSTRTICSSNQLGRVECGLGYWHQEE